MSILSKSHAESLSHISYVCYRLCVGYDLLYPGSMESSPEKLSVRCTERRYDAVAALDLCHSVGLY